jgi:hypothetical protein
MVPHCYSISSFVQRSADGDAKSLMYFNTFHASCIFFYFCYVLDVILRLMVVM